MKENEFLDGVSNIEPDVVERFVSMDERLQRKASRSKPKSIWLRIGAVAAIITVAVALTTETIVGLTMLNGIPAPTGSETSPPNSTDPTVTDTPKSKLSIKDIPGAEIIDDPASFEVCSGLSPVIAPPELYIEALKNASVAVGTATNVAAVTINDGEYLWYIVTFNLNVEENICNMRQEKTLTAISITKLLAPSEYGPAQVISTSIPNFGKLICEAPSGLYVMERITESNVPENIWGFDNTKCELSDYADYYVSAKWYSDDEALYYGGGYSIDLDNIREN